MLYELNAGVELLGRPLMLNVVWLNCCLMVTTDAGKNSSPHVIINHVASSNPISI